MTTTLKALTRGSLSTVSSNLYTVPSATTSIVTNITICNTTGSPRSFYLFLDGVELFSNTSINQYTTIVVDIKQALAATKVITGYADEVGLTYHFTGAEIS
jgi:hypothetical protein